MQVTYEFELTKSLIVSLASSIPSQNVDVVAYENPEPCAALLALAVASGRYSRFHEDPNISRKMFEQMYHTWIRNSTNHTAADTVSRPRGMWVKQRLAGFSGTCAACW